MRNKKQIVNGVKDVLDAWDLSCSEEEGIKDQIANEIADRIEKLFAIQDINLELDCDDCKFYPCNLKVENAKIRYGTCGDHSERMVS